MSRRRVRSISNVRLRGVRRGPARAERNCDVRRGMAEMEVVKRDGWRKRVRVTVSSREGLGNTVGRRRTRGRQE